MNSGRSGNHRRFGAFLLAATLLHAALLLAPPLRRAAPEPLHGPSVTVRLQATRPPAPEPEATPEPRPETPARPVPSTAPAPGRRVAQPPVAVPPQPAPAPERPAITAYRIISELAAERQRDPLAGLAAAGEPRGGFYAPFGPSLDEALNEPSLQLPFRDTRIYLVDSYDPGVGGSIDRFFDRVTVPFGFQTKNNTRIQCAWILVIAGCSWGDASLYYAGDRARRRGPGAD